MQNKILQVFLYNDKLKFNEIEKLTRLRSNVLAYYLKNFEKEKLIVKEGDSYSLSSELEYTIPYIGATEAALPTILIAIGEGKEFFLPMRKKRPYRSLLGMPAGRLLIGENIEDAVRRIVREKHGINVSFNNVKSVSLEHIKKKEKIINSFLQIFVSASTKDKIQYTNIEKNKSKMIKSDYWLLKNHQNQRYKLKTINSKI